MKAAPSSGSGRYWRNALPGTLARDHPSWPSPHLGNRACGAWPVWLVRLAYLPVPQPWQNQKPHGRRRWSKAVHSANLGPNSVGSARESHQRSNGASRVPTIRPCEGRWQIGCAVFSEHRGCVSAARIYSAGRRNPQAPIASVIRAQVRSRARTLQRGQCRF